MYEYELYCQYLLKIYILILSAIVVFQTMIILTVIQIYYINYILIIIHLIALTQ